MKHELVELVVYLL